MATTKITSPDLFNLESLNTALKLPSGTTAERPTSPSTGEWRYNTTTNLVEFWDGGAWRDLQSENIPPTPSEHFIAVTWTGDGTVRDIPTGFKPDFVWIKSRSFARNHYLYDSTRGANNQLVSNTTDGQATNADRMTAFNATSFTVGTSAETNNNGETYVAWCWKANGGTTTAGSGTNTTSVTNQVNTKAGFSISTFTGSASAAGNFTHGLGEVPDMYIVKSVSFADSWFVWHKDLTNTTDYAIRLNTNAAQQSLSGFWNNTAPTSTLISLGNGILVNNATYVAYAFKSVAGYSSIGSYTGNGSASGPIINTGFEPAWLMLKRADSTGSWAMLDNKRTPTNPRNKELFANLSDAENTFTAVNFLTNGFQIINTSNTYNANGGTFLYIAFASDASAAPTLADSFANKLWTGNDSTNVISGLGFQPSFVWIKRRVSGSESHALYDMLRGINEQLSSDSTAAQILNTAPNEGFSSFDTDGFTLGNNGGTNRAPNTYVGWSWKANSIPTINTNGTIQSVVSANQASGFSIVKWDGTGSASTVGHGLSAAPEIILTKRLNGTGDWYSFSTFLNSGTNPAYNFIKLNSSDAEIVNGSSGGSIWNSTSPTATVINVGTTLSGSTSDNYIAYCFTSISGFSKFGSYTGNSSTQAITGLGFSPSWVLLKEIDGVDSWEVYDTARGATSVLYPNGNNAEGNNSGLTSFDSDGFTLGSATSANESGKTYLYMAFKENPAQYAIPSGQMGYLVAAGGGSGANSGAGGGAGGLRTTYGTTSGGGASAETNLTLAAGTYTITVGAGGVSRGAGSSPPAYGGQGLSGSDSTITGVASVSTVGGGGGGSNSQSAAPPISASGLDGGSGGGQGPSAASGETPGSGTANEGFGGGTSSLSAPYGSGGGGGAGSAGGNRVSSTPGNGGDGLTISITGSNSGYAGGGGGSGGTSANFGLGTSGGGNGAPSTGTGISGTANTGGGGGGGGDTRAAGSGGSGIVVLRMNTSDYSGTTTGSPTVTTNGSETILTYTGSGTYVHSYKFKDMAHFAELDENNIVTRSYCCTQQ